MLLDDPRLLDQRRIAHKQRHPDRLLPHGALVDRSVFAQQEAVVAGENDQRLVELAAPLERVVDPADRVVHREDRRMVVADELAEVLQPVEVAVDAVPGLDALADPVG